MRGFRLWVLQMLGWVSLGAAVVVIVVLFSGTYWLLPPERVPIYTAITLAGGLANWAVLTGLAELLERKDGNL